MNTYHLKATEDDWELIREGTQKPVALFDGKGIAEPASIALVQSLGGTLKIYGPDDRVERVLRWPLPFTASV
ncbi:MAG TPA: hypothetical protein VG796_06970 [Verrucomicrobiales bacterium]|nr:hypothetical protein [Verrucomicrobiales bacterium]